MFSILLINNTFLQAQQFEIPDFALNNIKFNISVSQIPDSIAILNVFAECEGEIYNYHLHAKENKVDTLIRIPQNGIYNLSIPQLDIKDLSIRVIPGWLSIIPPLLAIMLALLIRQVIIALAAGIYAGALFIYNFDPLIAMLRFADKFMVEALTDRDHMFIILFTLLIGGVVGIISKNGGTTGLAKEITKIARNSRSGIISTWLMGVVIFFDDYANSLIIGNMMRPITDRLRISREKLAYIVDSTAAPIASIFIISTWIGYEVGLIGDGLRAISSTRNAYDVFIQSIPYSFYPIGAIFFVFLVAYFQRDFGPMYDAELRARKTGKVSGVDNNFSDLKDDEHSIYKGNKARWINGAVPILVILFGTILSLYITGSNSLKANGIAEYSIQDVINHSDSYSALLWSSFAACIVAVIMSISQKILNLEETIQAWTRGIQSMMVAAIILIFAWAISAVTNEMKTADYIISIISSSMDPRFLPALVFLVCALTSFSTGTSWGTMAIVTPIVIPLAHKLAVANNLAGPDYEVILFGVTSAILAGSVFGDHCSPIADTTVLSSLASKCNHIDHVNTQLPYAVVVGIFSMFIGYIPAAFGLSPYISMLLVFLASFGVLMLIGKKVPTYNTN